MVNCIYNFGLNIFLGIFNIFKNIMDIYEYIKYRFTNVLSYVLREICGYNDLWFFLEGHTYPIHYSNLNRWSREDSSWVYNKRTNEWFPIDDWIYCHKYHYFPWINGTLFHMTDIENRIGTELQATEFLNNQKIYYLKNKKYPTCAHIFGAFCLQKNIAFTRSEMEYSTFDVFTLNAEELSIPVRSDMDTDNKYYKSLCDSLAIIYENTCLHEDDESHKEEESHKDDESHEEEESDKDAESHEEEESDEEESENESKDAVKGENSSDEDTMSEDISTTVDKVLETNEEVKKIDLGVIFDQRMNEMNKMNEYKKE
jgi:hypothetical protein